MADHLRISRESIETEVKPERHSPRASHNRHPLSIGHPELPSASREKSNSLSKTAWEHYVERASLVDLELAQDWNQSMDILLLFAALFSAIITAFLIETVEMLEGDNDDEMKAILYRISLQLSNSTIAPIIPSDEGPSAISIAINGLFMAGLCASIMASLGAMLVKQWVYEYDRGMKGQSSPREHALWRQFRYEGLERWPVQEIVVALPIFMHISIAMFFLGLIFWVWSKSTAVAWVIAAFFVITSVLYISTTISPIFRVDAPFKTPIYSMYMAGIEGIVQKLGKGYRRQSEFNIASRETRAIREDKRLGRRSLSWLLRHTPQAQENAFIFISAIRELAEMKEVEQFIQEEPELWYSCLERACSVFPSSDSSWMVAPEMSSMWHWRPSPMLRDAAEIILETAASEISSEEQRQFETEVGAHIQNVIHLFSLQVYDRRLRVLGFMAAAKHLSPYELSQTWKPHLVLLKDCTKTSDLGPCLQSLIITQKTLQYWKEDDSEKLYRCRTILPVMREVLESNPPFSMLNTIASALLIVYGEEIREGEDVFGRIGRLLRVVDNSWRQADELGISVQRVDCVGLYHALFHYLIRQTTENATATIVYSPSFSAARYAECLIALLDLIKIGGPESALAIKECRFLSALRAALTRVPSSRGHNIQEDEQLLLLTLRCAATGIGVLLNISLSSTDGTLKSTLWQFIELLDRAVMGGLMTENFDDKAYTLFLNTIDVYLREQSFTFDFTGHDVESPTLLVRLATAFRASLPSMPCLDVLENPMVPLWQISTWHDALRQRCSYGIPKPVSDADQRLLRAILLSPHYDLHQPAFRAALLCKMDGTSLSRVLAKPALASCLHATRARVAMPSPSSPSSAEESTFVDVLHTMVIGWKFLVDPAAFTAAFLDQGGLSWLDSGPIDDDSYTLLVRITNGLGAGIGIEQVNDILNTLVYQAAFEKHLETVLEGRRQSAVQGSKKKEMTRWETLMVVLKRTHATLCNGQEARMAHAVERRLSVFP